MSNQLNVTQESAVSTDNFNPEQLPAVEAQAASQQQEVTEAAAEEVSSINQVKKAELIATFNELIENPKYWENENRIKRLEEALKLPKYDDRSKQQFRVSAEDELMRKAVKLSLEKNTVVVMPTEAEIEALVEEKYQKKLDAQEAKAEKAAKKNS